MGKRPTDIQMNVALGLGHSHEDTVQILRLLFHIAPISGRDESLPGFQNVTWLNFIGNAHRKYIQFLEILPEIAGFPTHIQHLEQTLLSRVITILGASLPLRKPD